MMIVASPAYLERHGTPLSPQELSGHRCLSYRIPTDGSPYRWELNREGEKLEVAVDGPLLLNDQEMLARSPRFLALSSGGMRTGFWSR